MWKCPLVASRDHNNMRTIQIRKSPLSASQYIDQCTAKNNRIACARVDFIEAFFRLIALSAAAIALAISAGGLIQVTLLCLK